MPYRFQYRNKKDRLVVALEDEEKVVIPSRLFPLERKADFLDGCKSICYEL